MNAATFFGTNYREATRRPGQPRQPGMKTLADQAGDQGEPGTKVRYRCPECQEMAVMKQMLAREDEEETGRRRLAVRCAKCNEEIELEAPRGRRWATRGSEAAAVFDARYRRALRERGLRHHNVVAAVRIR